MSVKLVKKRRSDIKDLTGLTFGKWSVENIASINAKNGGLIFICRCSCGTKSNIPGQTLLNGNSTACRKCGYEKNIVNWVNVKELKCPKCSEILPIEEFPKKGLSKKGDIRRFPYCKQCHVKNEEIRRMKYHFNLTVKERDTIFEYQKNCCAICGRPQKYGKKLSVDHNHKTGLIRGGLCWICNRTLGMVKENIKLMQNMILYLQNPPAIYALGECRYGRLGAVSVKKGTVAKLMKDRYKWLKIQEEILSKETKDSIGKKSG